MPTIASFYAPRKDPRGESASRTQLCSFARATYAVACLLCACGHSRPNSAPLSIVQSPIEFGAERRRLTREYIKSHYGTHARGISIDPEIIVLHWTANNDRDESYAKFQPTRLDPARARIARASSLNVSTHFLVSPDGIIEQLMTPRQMARHCIGLNLSAIAIENVGGENGFDNLTQAQVRSNARLVRWLKRRFPKISYLIGHFEYRRFEGHPLWREKSADYRTTKRDPGPRFLKLVHASVADLGLRPAPRGRSTKP